MFNSLEELKITIDNIRNKEKENGEEMFLDIPDRWFVDSRWRCRNDHVSGHYIKSEELGCGLCPVCSEIVMLTFPEDSDGSLL